MSTIMANPIPVIDEGTVDLGHKVPTIVSMGCRRTAFGESWSWHTHPYEEVCFFMDEATTVGHDGKRLPIRPNTVFLHRRGESHGFWNSSRQSPKLWVIHYAVDESFYTEVPGLVDSPPEARCWRLNEAQARHLERLFVKTSLEDAASSGQVSLACSACVQTILATLLRWQTDRTVVSFSPTDLDDELLQLWTVIRDAALLPFGAIGRFEEVVDNYDSLRHRFRKAFGLSPREMMTRLRMRRAQTLLLTGNHSIKEVASKVGYCRQHEFTRAFRRTFGVSPTEWLASPMKPRRFQ